MADDDLTFDFEHQLEEPPAPLAALPVSSMACKSSSSRFTAWRRVTAAAVDLRQEGWLCFSTQMNQQFSGSSTVVTASSSRQSRVGSRSSVHGDPLQQHKAAALTWHDPQ